MLYFAIFITKISQVFVPRGVCSLKPPFVYRLYERDNEKRTGAPVTFLNCRFSLHGKVEIDVNIEKETGEIKLHSDGLAINKVDIKTTAQSE